MEKIFNHIEELDYADCPDYDMILDQIVDIYNKFEMHALPVPVVIASAGVPLNSAVAIPAGVSNSAQTTKQWMVKQKPAHLITSVEMLRQ